MAFLPKKNQGNGSDEVKATLIEKDHQGDWSPEKDVRNLESVTIYCDTPCVRDLGALFGHVIKNNQF